MSKNTSVIALITIINKSSMIVMVLIGKLNTAPKQAHLIFLLLSTLCNTPMMLMLITINVTEFVSTGLKPAMNATPNNSSMKTYKYPYPIHRLAMMS